MKIHHDEQGVFIREYHDLWSFVGLRGWQFVNSWGYSWGYSWIRGSIRGWQFVNIMTFGHSWVYSWMAIRGSIRGWQFVGCFLGRRDGRVQDPRRTRPAPYERWAGTRPAPYGIGSLLKAHLKSW